MDYIKFKGNYNGKLDSDEFTTIRIYEVDRYKIGHVYNIILDDQIQFKAVILKMKPILDLRKLPDHIIKLDTGIDTADEFLKLMESFYGDLSNKKWVLITLGRIYESAE